MEGGLFKEEDEGEVVMEKEGEVVMEEWEVVMEEGRWGTILLIVKS